MNIEEKILLLNNNHRKYYLGLIQFYRNINHDPFPLLFPEDIMNYEGDLYIINRKIKILSFNNIDNKDHVSECQTIINRKTHIFEYENLLTGEILNKNSDNINNDYICSHLLRPNNIVKIYLNQFSDDYYNNTYFNNTYFDYGDLISITPFSVDTIRLLKNIDRP